MFITWIYADAEASRQMQNWNTLRDIGRCRSVVWACIGDHYKSQCQIDGFNTMMEDVHMEILASTTSLTHSAII